MMRVTLDTALAEQVVTAWRNRPDAALDDIVKKMEGLAVRGQLFTEQDRAFHMRLLEPLPNHLFMHLTEAFWAVGFFPSNPPYSYLFRIFLPQ